MATLWLCTRPIGENRSLKPDALMWIYMTVLLPRLTYAAIVWWSRI